MKFTIAFLGVFTSLLFLQVPKAADDISVADIVGDLEAREAVKLIKYPEGEVETIALCLEAETVQECFNPEPELEIPRYTADDLFCLAAVICCEAGGDSEEAQLMVGNVVLNRVAHHRYSNTVREVLEEPYQYGTMWKDGVRFPKWAREETVQKCYDIAKRLLEGERVCPEDVIYQAEFTQGSAVYAEIDGMYFCHE